MHILTLESIEEFLNHRKLIGIPESTINTDKSCLKKLYKWMGDDKMITPEIVLSYRESLAGNGRSVATQNSYMTSVNRYLRFMGEQEVHLPQNNIKDLSGQVFGHLTVIAPTDQRKRGSVVWTCRCQCGKEIDVAARFLTSGAKKSCGCCRREQYEIKDLTGQVFGRLTAIAPTEKRKRRYVVWKCKCQCGNEVEVESGLLTSGNIKSCGCWRQEQIVTANRYIDGTSLTHTLSAREKSKSAKSGYVGVVEARGKWQAYIYYKKKRYHLGTFDTLEEAVNARRIAYERVRQDALALERKYNELHNSY